jgi:glucose-1-phosphate adenylyltransferase
MSRTRNPKVLAVVLAGGEGKRLMPLTADRAKPAVPYGGIYRLIDFALSNVVNSGYLKIVVLTQYKSHSLDRHITSTWRMSTLLGNYVAPVPAQQRVGKRWYLGSADAIFQSLNLFRDERPDVVVVVGRGPRLPDGLLADGPGAPGVGGSSVGRGDPAADQAGGPVRRHRRGAERPLAYPRLPGEAHRPRRAAGRA